MIFGAARRVVGGLTVAVPANAEGGPRPVPLPIEVTVDQATGAVAAVHGAP